jgi:enoyl-CoA hydratase
MAFEVMRFAASPQYLSEMAFSGATYLSDDARTRGLVDEVVEPAELMNRAMAAAKALAALSPAAFAATKEQLRQPVADHMAKHAANVDSRAGQIWASADTIHNIRDYVARTFKKA